MKNADWIAGLSIAGLLLPEAVAYSGIAGLAPAHGVMALLAGLIVYGLLGRSRFAIVSATSSSAAVLLAATHSLGQPAMLVPLAMGMVLVAGLFFVLAGVARVGAVANLIAKPVLRGFALGLALTIVVKQLPTALGLHGVSAGVFGTLAAIAERHADWQPGSFAIGAGALALLVLLGRWQRVPGALIVIALGIALTPLGLAGGVSKVGALNLHFALPAPPNLPFDQWLRLGELAVALALILYAESYGSIRTFALRHHDPFEANRDLFALGVANIAAALLQGMPVGAGFSATSANEAAGAQSRAAGLVAGGTVLLALLVALPAIALVPEPVLAAIVIHAMLHSLNPAGLRPYFQWRRDRIVAIVAFSAVLVLGVLDGLLAAIGASIVMLLQRLSQPRVDWLGQLGDSHDYVDLARHPEAHVPPGVLIARPAVPLFFGNADPLLAAIRARVLATPGLLHLVLSLEETPDLDGTALEAIGEFATAVRAQGARLSLARVKDPVRDLLVRLGSADLPPEAFAWSVDDAVKVG